MFFLGGVIWLEKEMKEEKKKEEGEKRDQESMTRKRKLFLRDMF